MKKNALISLLFLTSSFNYSYSQNNNELKKTPELKPTRFALYVNPLGFLQFGPIAGAEITVRSHFIFGIHARITSLGLLSRAITADAEDGRPTSVSGWGAGTDMKFIKSSSGSGFYFGFLNDFGGVSPLYHKADNSKRRRISYLSFFANIGYKIRFRSGIYMNLGAMPGIINILQDEWYYLRSPNNDFSTHQGTTAGIHPIGMLEFSVGKEF